MTEPHLIGGRYEVGELLGRGGMAEVRKGRDVRLGRTVAIKRLRTDLASDSTFQSRFRREAQAAASLNDSTIVAVYDTGEEMASDGSNVAQPYIVMEYVAGRTLRDILREGRKILPERALEITSGVLTALDYSHRAGIIHRDIKPGNVMLTPAGDVKVMDFGIARAVSDASSTMTQTAAVVGTAQYLSPEQARGETVDARSDIYSTGCLLYELLTGRPPFVGDNPVSVAYQHVREQPVPPSSLDEDLPPEIDAIVMKALAKNVGERYPSAAAMKKDIDRYLQGLPVQAPAVAAAPVTAFLPPDQPTNDTGSQTSIVPAVEDDEDERRSKAPFILLALLLLALVVAALVFGPRLLDSGTQQTQVPSVQGMTRQQAERTIRAQDLQVGEVTTDASEDTARGRVISQDPQPQDQVDVGTEVNLVISTGPPKVEVPDVVGDDKDDAADELRNQGFDVALSERDSPEPQNKVVEMQPPAGTMVKEGSKITLFWSSGPQKVPNVVGKTEGEARSILERAGFKVDVVEDSSTKAKKGTVLRQSPSAGSEEDKGSTVFIVVSTYESPKPSPSPSESPPESPSGSPTP